MAKRKAAALVEPEPVSTRPAWLQLLDASGFLDGETFRAHRTLARAIAADPLTDSAEDAVALALYRLCTGRQNWPTAPAVEVWVEAGRGGGKSSLAAKIGACKGATFDPATVPTLARGEVVTIMLLASDREQAGVMLNYLRGCFEHPALAPLLAGPPLDEKIVLRNRCTIEVHTSNYRATRGRTLLMCEGDEISFWDRSVRSNPDHAVLNAVRPGLRLPDSLAMFMSTVYSRRGALYEHDRAHWGVEEDPILVWRATTEQMNPSFSRSVIARARSVDPAAAAAEYDSVFRSDLEQYLTVDLLDAATERVADRGALDGPVYCAFIDPSGAGSDKADSMVLAIAHPELAPDGTVLSVLDHVDEVRPPFSPDGCVARFAATLAVYGIGYVQGDKYAGNWPTARFAAHGIAYEPSPRPKGQIYLDCLPLFSSERARLLDLPRVRSQLLNLERRTGRQGKDAIDHAPGAKDDVANAACGALLMAQEVALALAEPRDPDAYDQSVMDSFARFADAPVSGEIVDHEAGYVNDETRWSRVDPSGRRNYLW